MPSQLPLPTIAELRKAFHDGVRSKLGRADSHAGAAFDHWAGIGAIFWSRQAQRDKDLFHAVYDGSAEGDDLTSRYLTRYGTVRNVDAYGVGTATLARPSAGAGAGTFFTGTRIVLSGSSGQSQPATYAVLSDTPVGASALSANVPVRATVTGLGTAIDSTLGGLQFRVDDVLWDPSWSVASLKCSDGTVFEPAPVFRARTHTARLNGRVGYRRAILDACARAGAANVALFSSDFGGSANDGGVSACYVGDAGYSAGTVLFGQVMPSVAGQALINSVLLALESVRVAGCAIQVLPMVTAPLSIVANVYLWDDPGKVDTVDLRTQQVAALQGMFTAKEGGFAYRLDAMAGAMTRVSDQVQSVAWVSPSADLNVMSGVPLAFPPYLTKWTVATNNVVINYLPPQ